MKIFLSLSVVLLVLLIETTNAIEESDSYFFVSPRDDLLAANDPDVAATGEETRDSELIDWNTKRASEWKLRGGKRGPEWKLRGGKRGPEWKLRGGKRGPEWKLRGGKRWGVDDMESSWSHPDEKKLTDWKLKVGKKRSFLGGKRVPGNWMLRGGKRAPVNWMLRGGKRSNGWRLEPENFQNANDNEYPSSREDPLYYFP